MNAKPIFFSVLCAAAAALSFPLRADADFADPSAPPALVDWEPSSSWSVGLAYVHRLRPVEADNGPEWTIAGETYDAFISFAWNWLELRAFGGATQARLKEFSQKDLDPEAGGGASLALNLWQISPDAESCAWRALLRLEGRGEWRTTSNDAGASLEWFEGFAAMPLYYLLSATRSRRTPDVRDFHALGAYVGPAFSVIDGRRELGGTKTSFEQSDLYGAAGGVELWLLRNLRFGGRLEYFGDCTWSIDCTYVF